MTQTNELSRYDNPETESSGCLSMATADAANTRRMPAQDPQATTMYEFFKYPRYAFNAELNNWLTIEVTPHVSEHDLTRDEVHDIVPIASAPSGAVRTTGRAIDRHSLASHETTASLDVDQQDRGIRRQTR